MSTGKAPAPSCPKPKSFSSKTLPPASLYIYMLHDLKTLHLDPAAAKFAAVLHGHTHVPNFVTKKGVLYFNPGSCGPRRFELPVTIGLLTVNADGELGAEILALNPRS